MDIESSTKEELAKLGTQALKDLYENLAGAKQFVLAQAPDICQQMINWQIAQGCMAALAAAVTITATVIATHMAMAATKDPQRYANNEEMLPTIAAVVSGAAALAASVIAVAEGFCAVKAMVAPKLFLLERIAAMLR